MKEEFSYKMTKRVTGLVLLGLLTASVFALAVSVVPKRAFAATTNDFINIDLNQFGPDNVNDFPYGINCDDPNHVYVTLFGQGRLVEINKANGTVLASYNDPEGNISGGQGFYSIARDPNTGNLFINEQNNGKVWKVNPTDANNTSGWRAIPIVQEITGNPKVTYPSTFNVAPNLIRIDENPGPFGVHTYMMSMQSFGGAVYANGNIYVGLGYNSNFSNDAFTYANQTSISFYGLAKIDPTTNTVMRIPIPGSQTPTGITVDANNTSILWVTDQGTDKVFKFDTNSNTVTQTISLAAGSRPRGIDDNGSYLFVALNQNFIASDGHSEILKISKADTSQQVIIDTGAENTSSGTFTVFVAGNLLLWTDESRHVGAINLTNNATTFQTTTYAVSNHFGCLVNSSFWFAGQGSAVVGEVNIPDLESQLGGSNQASAGAPISFKNLISDSQAIIAGKYTTTKQVSNPDGSTSTIKALIPIPDVSLAGQPVPGQPNTTFSSNLSLYDIARGDSFGLMSVAAGAYLAGIDWGHLTENQQLYLYVKVMYG